MNKLPKFVCTLIDKNGQRVKQKIEGPSPDAVSTMLKNKGYYLVSIKEESFFDKDFFYNLVSILLSFKSINTNSWTLLLWFNNAYA